MRSETLLVVDEDGFTIVSLYLDIGFCLSLARPSPCTRVDLSLNCESVSVSVRL